MSHCLLPILGLDKRQSQAVTVAGDGVYKAVAEVDCVLRNAGIRDYEHYLTVCIPGAEIGAHQAWVAAHAGGREKDAG